MPERRSSYPSPEVWHAQHLAAQVAGSIGEPATAPALLDGDRA